MTCISAHICKDPPSFSQIIIFEHTLNTGKSIADFLKIAPQKGKGKGKGEMERNGAKWSFKKGRDDIEFRKTANLNMPLAVYDKQKALFLFLFKGLNFAIRPIVGFHSRDQQPCFSTKTKENVCIIIELNSRRIWSRLQHGRRFFA